MRLATVLLACSVVLANIGFTPAAKAADQTNSISNMRLGGWIGKDALLVLPNRQAGVAAIGGNFGGAKVVSIGDTSMAVEYGGVKGNITIDPAPQLAPHPDLTNWLIDYMQATGLKIDAQAPDTSKSGVIHIMHNGGCSSDFLKVAQASPFQALPYWMESIDLNVVINPGSPTKTAFASMTITPDAYARLMKPLYAVPTAAK